MPPITCRILHGQHLLLHAFESTARADVREIKCVVNYDMPHTAEDYVHRYFILVMLPLMQDSLGNVSQYLRILN